MSKAETELPRVWEDPAGFFAEAEPQGRRPDDLTRGCIDYIEQSRAHPPRLRRSPGILRVVDALRTWGYDHLNDLDEQGLDALRDVLDRLLPFSGHELDDLMSRARGRIDLVRLRRKGRPSKRLLALCEAAVAASTDEELEELHDRFSPIDRELRAGLLDLETRYPDLAELAVPHFERPVQEYAIERASRVQTTRRIVFVSSIALTIGAFVVRCT